MAGPGECREPLVKQAMLNIRQNDSARLDFVARMLHSHASNEEGVGSWLQLMRADFRLAMVTLFCVSATLVVTPFAFYRFLAGEYPVAVADTVLVTMFVAVMVFVWKTGRSDIAGTFTAAFGSTATLALLVFLELNHSWIFAALVANFLLASRPVAIAFSSLLIILTGVVLREVVAPLDLATIVGVAILMSLFALIFASRVDSQHRQLTELAVFDPLTGAGNRRMLKVDMAAMVDDARHCGEPCALAVLDLDHFKQVNDDHGHEAGDQVLMDLARIVQQTMRRADRFYRFGGEEFVLLLPDTPPDKAERAMHKLLEAVRAQLQGPAGPVTVSVGLASLMPGEEAADWLNRADRALYQAKDSGRDCLVMDAGGQMPAAAAVTGERRSAV